VSYTLSILEHAEDDYSRMYQYILKRSPAGATRWEESLEQGLARLLENPLSFGFAPENDKLDIELRQLLFGTKQGLTYRAIFTIEANIIYILRFRGPGQRPLKAKELKR
jgi:plasmid stabilization system protein ParE